MPHSPGDLTRFADVFLHHKCSNFSLKNLVEGWLSMAGMSVVVASLFV